MNELPALTLLDLILPRVVGLQALRRIRADERTSRLAVIILTTPGEEQDIAQSYDLGTNCYIRKPVGFKQFAEAIQRLGLYWLVMNEPARPKRGDVDIPLAALIVEDSENDTQLIVHLLKKAGYGLVYERVETTEQMCAALEKRAWDIVISDYSLPQFDGRAALELLKEKHLDIPFIVVSGMIGEERAVAMMKAGVHDYLMKGNLARLAPAVARELSQAEVRREQKQMEAQLRQLSRAVEHNPASIVITDINGSIEYVNPKFTAVTGYTFDEVRGKTPPYVFGSEMQPEIHTEHSQTILSGKEWRGEMLYRKKSGASHWEAVSISPITNSKGVITHFVAVSEDITRP